MITEDDIKELRSLVAADRLAGLGDLARLIDALLAERERLVTEKDALQDVYNSVFDESLRIAKERDALRADAERWHWARDWMIKQGLLRHQECQPEAKMGVDWWYVFRKVYVIGDFISYGSTPDAAIDAAQKEQG